MPSPDPNLLRFMDECPPCIVRIMSVDCGKGRKPRLRTNEEIEAASGLGNRMIRRLAQMKTWKGVKIGVASKFIEACNVEVINTQPKGGTGSKKMTRYYFFRNYICKDFPHLTDDQRKRIKKLMEWE